MLEVDLVDALEARRAGETVHPGRVGADLARTFGGVVALYHQAGGGVQHLEVRRQVAGFLEGVFPLLRAVLAAGHVQRQDAGEGLALVAFGGLGLGVPQRPLEHGVERLAVG